MRHRAPWTAPKGAAEMVGPCRSLFLSLSLGACFRKWVGETARQYHASAPALALRFKEKRNQTIKKSPYCLASPLTTLTCLLKVHWRQQNGPLSVTRCRDDPQVTPAFSASMEV